MKFLTAFLPNLTIALNISLLIVVYIDRRNPMMGFLIGAPFLTLAISTAVCSILTSVVLYSSWRRSVKGKKKREK